MCGVTGLVDLAAMRPIPASHVEMMNAALRHRGPDGDGFHHEPGVSFGHRRLSIIDLEGGRQPLFNEDGTVVITFNGEIYNFQALEAELKAAGHVFRTRCDTEVIVHAWEQWGAACLDKLNGMFAFAIWDRNRQTLFIARDRLGIKPLYYCFLPDGVFAFASELKALMVHPESNRQLDPRSVEDYFTFGYVPDPATIYKEIRKLEPGCHLMLRRGEAPSAPVRYWDVPLWEAPHARASSDAVSSDLISELKRSVESQLVADVPLGAFLSGGIDSSAIVAMMRQCDVPELLTCSIGFEERKYDESEFARLVATAKNTNHRMEYVAASNYDLLDQLVDIYDEPYADSSAIPTYRVCELARRHVKVVLSGDGGDENFVGYRRYRLFSAEQRLRNAVPLAIRRQVFGPLGRFYPKLDWAPRVFRGKTTFQALARTTTDAYRHGVSICSDEFRSELFSSSFRSELQGYSAAEVFERYLANKSFADPMRLVQYLDFKTYLPGDILTKVDRASMAHSLEVRVPLLDHKLVEWAAHVPTCWKLRKGQTKYILKKALEPYLPKEILYRQKMGFAVPLDIWFRQSLEHRIDETINSGRLQDCGMFRPDFLSRIWSEHRSGKRDHAAPLWALLMFDGFLAKHMG